MVEIPLTESIYTNSAHQRMIGLVNITKDSVKLFYLVSWLFCTWGHFLARREIHTIKYKTLHFKTKWTLEAVKLRCLFIPFHTNLQFR